MTATHLHLAVVGAVPAAAAGITWPRVQAAVPARGTITAIVGHGRGHSGRARGGRVRSVHHVDGAALALPYERSAAVGNGVGNGLPR